MPEVVYIVRSNVGLPMGFDTLEEAEDYVHTTPSLRCKIIRKSIVGCARCDRADFSDVPHFNCIYRGQAVGHSSTGHCTADACF